MVSMNNAVTAETAKFLRTAESLPIEMRLAIIDRLLETVQPVDPEVDRLWIAEAEKRSDDIKSGKVKPIAGRVFLQKAREKLGL